MTELIEQGTIKAVAEALLGEANERLSSTNELRFGNHGSLSVDLGKDCWHDHEQNTGGGVLDLIQRCAGLETRAEQVQWLQEHGLPAPTPRKAADKPRIASAYDYRDEAGALVFQVVRMEPKTFRQRRPDGNGGWEWKVRGTRQVPYRLPELQACALDALVYVVEGEKDADRLVSLGLVATCNAGGAGKWRKDHAQFLQGRRVVILPDNDEAGQDHAQKVAKSLQGIAAEVRTVVLPELPDKGDVSDWLDAGGTVEALQELATAAPAAAASGEEEGERKRSQTDLLVAYAREHFDLLHDSNGDVYAKDRHTGEVGRLGGLAFKDRLVSGFYRKTEMAVRDQAMSEAMGTLRALGRFTGDPQGVHIRAAGSDGRYFIDLCQAGNSRAIEVDASGWRVLDRPPVLFVRGASMQPLPDPIQGGSMAQLWAIANVPDSMHLLVLAWLIDSIRPETPFPGLELIGEQGSGKSTAAEALRRLIDPSACNLRGAPKTVEDIFVAAGQNHVVAYENVSHLAGPMQDALAILSTGGGFAKRQLYTDGEEHVISVQRPWMVNGISVAVTQQDLVDRVISIECPVIETRQSSSQQWKDFDAALPGILGALLDITTAALHHLPDMKLPREDRPRLVEYVLLGMAVAKACGRTPAGFLAQFKETRAETVARTLDASPVAAAVLDFIEETPLGTTAPVKDIMARLEAYKPAGAEAWPRSPKGLGDALRRAAPALRQMGIECKCLGKGSGGVVRWTLKKKVAESKSQMSQVPTLDSADELGHGTSGTSQPQVSAGAEL